MSTLERLDTPSLVVDLDVMEKNCAQLREALKQTPHELRPHTKAHKIPDIAKMQLAHGARGICTAKLGEAEVMAAGGIDDVLITTPIANPIKVRRLVHLRKSYPHGRFIQVVDHPTQVQAIATEAVKQNVTIELLVEIESGQKRCGVEVGDGLIVLIKKIKSTKGVRYAGIQAYSGHLQHVHGYEERRKQARAAVQPVFEFINTVLNKNDLAPEIISGGGTGTYDSYDNLPFTEIQAGSYLFMDADYHKIGSKDGDTIYKDFGCALKVWTTVISKPTPTRAVVDAGMKALSIDSGMPLVADYPEVTYKSGGDEHGILTLPQGFAKLDVGERLLMIPSHCDTTLNQFSKLYGWRNNTPNNTIEKEWTIEGRGRSD